MQQSINLLFFILHWDWDQSASCLSFQPKWYDKKGQTGTMYSQGPCEEPIKLLVHSIMVTTPLMTIEITLKGDAFFIWTKKIYQFDPQETPVVFNTLLNMTNLTQFNTFFQET